MTKKLVLSFACLAMAGLFSFAAPANKETAKQAVLNMNVGLNLNNSLEEHYKKGDRSRPETFETQTGRPVTTPAIIQAFADAGFGVVRVPVTWYNHMDPETFEVDKVWMDRVEEVVGYILDAGMYCILDVHHDAGSKDTRWLIADMDKYPEVSVKFKSLWRQIALRFKNHSYRLLFEGYNEILDIKKSWSQAKVEGAYEAANRLNQDFVDVVRKTGGRNRTRNLVVSTYATSVSPKALDAFVLPSDKVPGHLAVQVHCYKPSPFTSPKDSDAKEFKEEDKPMIDKIFEGIDERLLKKGYPVVLGEFGAWNKKNEEDRARHAEYFVHKCHNYGILPIYWYNPMHRYDRKTCTWTYPLLRDALINTR